MTRRPLPPGIPSDPGLPGARGLLAADGLRFVSAFLGARGWQASEIRPVQALYRPGRSCLVRYRARAEGPDGSRRIFSVCAETSTRQGEPPVPDERIVERSGLPDPVERRNGSLVWAFPYDPSLPEMTDAAWGPAVRESLTALGERPAAVSVEALRYRPRRRAVFRYRMLRRGHGERRWDLAYGKVVGPSEAERATRLAGAIRNRRLVGRRASVRLGLPVTTAGEQLLLFEALPGRSLRDLFVHGGSLPRPDRVAALLDTLPDAAAPLAGAGLPEAPDPAERAASAAALIERLVPESGPAARRVADAVAEGASRESVSHRIVHGDLYEAQVMVDEDYALGLIDLDDMGVGDPAVDAATFCAHLVALALSVPTIRGRLLAYRTLVRRAFAARLGIPSGELSWRESLRMLLLAPGPFRVVDEAWPREVRRRVDLAVRLLAGA